MCMIYIYIYELSFLQPLHVGVCDIYIYIYICIYIYIYIYFRYAYTFLVPLYRARSGGPAADPDA